MFPQRFGAYVLLDLLGRGGMAEVFLAVHSGDLSAKRKLVVKKILPEFAASPEHIQQLINEATVAKKLKHRHIVRYIDMGVVGNSVFLCLEWVCGQTFRRVIDRDKDLDADFRKKLAIHTAEKALNALAYAHELKDASNQPLHLVHCDISPDNIMLGYDGELKLLDFGLARWSRQVAPASKLYGKNAYLAPEVLQGGPHTPRSDLYSLGILTYEVLTSKRPFEAQDVFDLQNRILHQEIDFDPLGNATEMRNFVTTLLERDPQRRYPSASEALQALPQLSESDRLETVELGAWISRSFVEESAADDARMNLSVEDALTPSEVSVPAFPDELDEMGGNMEEVLQITSERTEFVPASEASNSSEKRAKKEISKIGLQKKRVERVVKGPLAVEEIPSNPEQSPFDFSWNQSNPEFQTPRIRPTAEPDTPIELATIPAPIMTGRVQAQPSAQVRPTSPKVRTSPRNLTGPFFIFAGVLIALGLLVSMTLDRFFSPAIVYPGEIQEVDCILTIENDARLSSEEVALWISTRRPEEVWAQNITRLLENEFVRITGEDSLPLTLTIHLVKGQVESVDASGSFLNRFRLFKELARTAGVAFRPDERRGRLYVHLYAKEDHEAPKYPLDYQGARPKGQGIVFVPYSEREDLKTTLRLLHETGHILGATDKYVPGEGLKLPQGLAEPDRSPIFPQDFAEWMTPGVPLSAKEFRPVTSLREVRIGPASATEIHWTETGKNSIAP